MTDHFFLNLQIIGGGGGGGMAPRAPLFLRAWSLVWYIQYFWSYYLVFPGSNNMNPYLHLALRIADF